MCVCDWGRRRRRGLLVRVGMKNEEGGWEMARGRRKRREMKGSGGVILLRREWKEGSEGKRDEVDLKNKWFGYVGLDAGG